MLIKYYESIATPSTLSTKSINNSDLNSTNNLNSINNSDSNSTNNLNSINNINSTPISQKRPRVVSPPSEMTQQIEKTQQSILWSDSVSPEMISLQHNKDINDKLDKLANMFLDFQTNAIEKQESTQNMFDRMMVSIDTLLSRNEKLEQRIENLQSRLQVTEKKLATRQITASVSNEIDTGTSSSTTITTSSTNVVTTENQPSWAYIAKSPPMERQHLSAQKAQLTVSRPERLEGFQALSLLTCKTRRLPPKRQLEIGKTKAIYFSGFEFQKLGTIWNALKKAWFKTSLIASIQWVGKTVLEFVIAIDYEDEFSSELTSNKNLNFKIIKFDPTQNLKATTLEQSQYAMKAFVVRCVKNIFLSSNLVARRHFELLAEKSCNLNPTLKSLYETEYLQCKNEIEKETNDLIIKLSQLGAEEDSDYPTSIQRLRLLQPTHPLVTQYLQNKIDNADSKPSEALAVSHD